MVGVDGVTAFVSRHAATGGFVDSYMGWVATGASWYAATAGFLDFHMEWIVAHSSWYATTAGFVDAYMEWFVANASWYAATAPLTSSPEHATYPRIVRKKTVVPKFAI